MKKNILLIWNFIPNIFHKSKSVFSALFFFNVGSPNFHFYYKNMNNWKSWRQVNKCWYLLTIMATIIFNLLIVLRASCDSQTAFKIKGQILWKCVSHHQVTLTLPHIYPYHSLLLWVASSVCKKPIYVSFCWLTDTGMFMCRSLKENVADEFILASPAVPYLNGLWDGSKVAVQLLFWGELLPRFVRNCM